MSSGYHYDDQDLESTRESWTMPWEGIVVATKAAVHQILVENRASIDEDGV